MYTKFSNVIYVEYFFILSICDCKGCNPPVTNVTIKNNFGCCVRKKNKEDIKSVTTSFFGFLASLRLPWKHIAESYGSYGMLSIWLLLNVVCCSAVFTFVISSKRPKSFHSHISLDFFKSLGFNDRKLKIVGNSNRLSFQIAFNRTAAWRHRHLPSTVQRHFMSSPAFVRSFVPYSYCHLAILASTRNRSRHYYAPMITLFRISISNLFLL